MLFYAAILKKKIKTLSKMKSCIIWGIYPVAKHSHATSCCCLMMNDISLWSFCPQENVHIIREDKSRPLNV